MKEYALQEKELLNKALLALEQKADIHFSVREQQNRKDRNLKYHAKITHSILRRPINFFVEIKKQVTRATLGPLLNQLEQIDEPKILVTNYINDPLARDLIEKKIFFIDTAGNAYIHQNGLHIQILGNKPDQPPTKAKDNKLFKPSGLHILFFFLSNPGSEKLNYRETAKIANVAHGSVGWFMRDLRLRGYLIERKNEERILTRKKELFERWVTAYLETLRPKLFVGKFKTLIEPLSKFSSIAKDSPSFLSGELGGEIYTKHIKAANAAIYSSKSEKEIIKDYKLIPDKNGHIEVLKTFWEAKPNRQGIASPVLVYADLMETALSRNIETAKILYDKEIKNLIEQN